MFWLGKKKRTSDAEEVITENEIMDEETDYVNEEQAEAEIDEVEEVEEFDEDMEIPDVTVKIASYDDLAEFINNRAAGALQFMNKETNEAFEIREAHIRMAGVWGSLSMAKECTPLEYSKVMLAIELTKDPERFYVLPGLTEKEVKKAVNEFCEDRFNVDGRKYASDLSKFSKFLDEEDAVSDWKVFTKEAVYDKVIAFCDNNEIIFDIGAIEADE